MRIKGSIIFSFLLLQLLFSSQLLSAQIERPKLVIGIVVDQMRWDYLYRYSNLYGKGGFKRLLDKGYNCQQTFINYLPTYTAVGHAAIYTGSVPAFNGIVANSWINRKTGNLIYCVEDDTAISVGGSAKAGKMSPRNLLATTITDELRLATNFKSRVFGISIKDRGAILPAGHTANAAFWYDEKNAHFITSNYYLDSLPDWLIAFNSKKIGDNLMKQGWQTLYDKSKYRQSSLDNNAYEGVLKGETRPVFPHHFYRKDKKLIRYTPFANTLLRLLGQTCIQEERLGRQGYTDFLTISFSATDYAGHLFGPNAIETEDIYLRLDKEIAAFLRFLDQYVGKGNYLLFLTADHGAAQNARFMQDHKIPAKSISIRVIKNELNQYLSSIYKAKDLVRSLYNYQVYLNNKIITQHNIDRDRLLMDIENWLGNQEGVTAVYDLENGTENYLPEPLKSMIKNSFYRNRCGSLQIIFNPQWYSKNRLTGTSHGSWHPYNTHIPLIWYGWHIPRGETYQTISITDIAATLAALLHIQMPNASVGKVIQELFE